MNSISVIGSAILPSQVAGMGTGLDGLLAIIRKPGKRSFGFLMGMTAGVMICLSFLELVNEARVMEGFITVTIGFSTGAIFIFPIDFFVPYIRYGEREMHALESNSNHEFYTSPLHSKHRYRGYLDQTRIVDRQLLKTGMLLAIGITIHNIPEVIAVRAGYMHTPEFGFIIA